MEINNSFEVPLPPTEAWKVLMDIERIAPCMPGAELTGKVDNDTYNGKVSVKLGPVALAFAGQVKFTEIDEANRKARAKAQGKDSKGRGGANATVDFHLEPIASRFAGRGEDRPHALGRGRAVWPRVGPDPGRRLATHRPVRGLSEIQARRDAADVAAAQPAKPISGFSLMFRRC